MLAIALLTIARLAIATFTGIHLVDIHRISIASP
jgi:hypothetical protein